MAVMSVIITVRNDVTSVSLRAINSVLQVTSFIIKQSFNSSLYTPFHPSCDSRLTLLHAPLEVG